MPSQIFANNTIVFGRTIACRDGNQGVAVGKRLFRRQYKLPVAGKRAQLEYRMTVRTMDRRNIEKLSNILLGLTSIVEFNISMAGSKRPSIIVPLSKYQ